MNPNTESVQPETVEKPWGSFRRFTLNEKSTVKILNLMAGEQFSLQKHEHRTEFWRILRGKPMLTIGDTEIEAEEGGEYTVPAGTPHRISAQGENAEILEISVGMFDEDDIMRLSDKYGRA